MEAELKRGDIKILSGNEMDLIKSKFQDKIQDFPDAKDIFILFLEAYMEVLRYE